jgi:uncharacterized OB-fold protein
MADSSMLAPHPPQDEPYWEGLRNSELKAQRCLACHHVQHYPRQLCRNCQSNRLEWVTTSGGGTIYTMSVVSRAPSRFAAGTPYVIAIVELDEGPRMMTRIVGSDPAAVSIGARVRVTFGEIEKGLTLPLFELDSQEGSA